MPPNGETLAHEFSAALRATLSRKEFQAVILQNRYHPKNNVCHSHDFCDANMVLHEVFMRYAMDITVEGGTERWGQLWDETWNVAKANEFRLYNRHKKFTSWRRIMKSA